MFWAALDAADALYGRHCRRAGLGSAAWRAGWMSDILQACESRQEVASNEKDAGRSMSDSGTDTVATETSGQQDKTD
jgi:hypothetical protein